MARIDYEQVAADYTAARGLTVEGLGGWRRALGPYLTAPALPVVDIGSGAGQFANLFPGWFDVDVIGVEPSDAMRRQAEAARTSARVRYMSGDAEHLPLESGSCGAAWMSTVIHHIPDLASAAREIRRVLAPGGPVLIRSAFPGRTCGISLCRYFPETADVIDTFPSVAQVARDFGAAGFRLVRVEPVPQISIPNLAEMRPRVELRADTTLRGISDRAFIAGLARLDAAIAAGHGDDAVVDYLDLLVFR